MTEMPVWFCTDTPMDFASAPYHRAAMNAASAQDTLIRLDEDLKRLKAGVIPLHSFLSSSRNAHPLLQALPPRFGEVLHSLLDRLESSALFSEESCSFSQQDLVENLQIWVDKARGRIAA